MSSTEQVEKHVLKKYELLHKIGKGAYGIVWKAKNKKSQEIVALKKIFLAFQNEQDAQRTYREVIYLSQFHHENIVRLINVMPAENNMDIYLVFEFMQTDLHHAIQAGVLQDVHQQYIMYQLCRSLKYLHSGDLLHRDLKPSNLLLNSSCDVKLADFGLSRSLHQPAESQEQAAVYTDYVATRWYRPPELLMGSPNYDKPVDIWAVGCIIGEILGKAPMFPGTSTTNQIDLILQVTGKPSPEDIKSLNSPFAMQMIENMPPVKSKRLEDRYPKGNADAIDLMKWCLQFNPNKRPTIQECLDHKYFAQFKNAESEITASEPFALQINDNQKLKMEEYREQLYLEIGQLKQKAKARAKAGKEVPKEDED